MSEKYGDCLRCRGRGEIWDDVLIMSQECPRCHGTGFEGSAMFDQYYPASDDASGEY